MNEELKPDEVKAIAAELDAWNSRYARPQDWAIHAIVHLYDLPIEAYEIIYEDDYSQVWFRNDAGKLEPAATATATRRSRSGGA